MILTCPSCAARFLVNSAAIGADGREVRCGRCGNSWFARPSDEAPAAAAPPPPLAAAPAAAEPHPEPTHDGAPAIDGDPTLDDGPPPIQEPLMHPRDADRAVRPEARPRRANVPAIRPAPRRWPARLAWVALIAVLIGIGAVASVYREEVIAALPAAAPLYAAVGMESAPLGFGLNLIIDESDQSERDGQTVLRVSGRIENTSATPIRIPDLRAALFDAEERELQGWTFSAPVASLPPNRNAPFKTEFANPAKNAVRLEILFHENK